MAKKTPLNGTCAICNATITKKEAKKHISACLRESGRDAKAMGRKKSPAKLFHLLVEGYGLSGDLYWMHLKALGSARLRDLDTLLRDTWLECCGHLREFTIGGWGGLTLGKVRKADSVFQPGVVLRHLYDFGTTSETDIRVMGLRVGQASSKAAMLPGDNQESTGRIPCIVLRHYA